MPRCILSFSFAILMSVAGPLAAEGTKPVVRVVVKEGRKQTPVGKSGARERVQALVKKQQKQQSAALRNLYGGLQKDVADAIKSLESAGKSATNDPKAMAAEAAQLQQAKTKIDAALRAINARQGQLRSMAAQQRRVVATTFGNSGYSPGVRTDVDRSDKTERFLLLLPDGPIVVQAELTIDGKPFRAGREDLIMKMMAAADVNRDGKATWLEAIQDRRFTLGRVRIQNETQAESYRNMFDRNRNKLVERDEIRYYLARFYSGAAFVVTSLSPGVSAYRGGGAVFVNGRPLGASNGNQRIVLELLDKDGDGSLSTDEIERAAEQLKDRDTDDNDLLLPNEITGTPARTNYYQSTRMLGRPGGSQMAVLLGPASFNQVVHANLKQQYGDKEGLITADQFSAVPKLFEKLDADANGELDIPEMAGFNKVTPHLELTVDVGRDTPGKGIEIVSVSDELPPVEKRDDRLVIAMPGMRLDLQTSPNRVRTNTYASAAKNYLTQNDKDKNGYLEKSELSGFLAQNFEMWDGDRDGKVFEKEINNAYTMMVAPQLNQIWTSVISRGNPFFKAIDRSGDGRLSLREMKTAAERLKSFDKNSDGTVSAEEVPRGLSVTFVLGASAAYANRAQGIQRVGTRPATQSSDAPDWFTRMDRNGDGDVTLKEFLGGKDDFKRLDTNEDGFIEAAEAKAAEAKKPGE